MSIEPPAALSRNEEFITSSKIVQNYSRRKALFTPKLQTAGAKYAIQSGDVDRATGTDYGDRTHEKFAMPAQVGEVRKIGLLSDAYYLQPGDILGFIPSEDDTPLQLWKVLSAKDYEWNRGIHVEISFVGLIER
jgi:hypothetical protein